jgi:hypothetical protein
MKSLEKRIVLLEQACHPPTQRTISWQHFLELYEMYKIWPDIEIVPKFAQPEYRRLFARLEEIVGAKHEARQKERASQLDPSKESSND